MRPTDEQRTSQDTERSRSLTINHIPDELLLEIFDFYRQDIDPYEYHWRKKHVWIKFAHVCRKWRAVMLASASRLDLGITVGPEKPGHIKAILSSSLPIIIDYKCMYRNIIRSALWRLRAALRHHDRVREITFEGTGVSFEKLLRETNRPFPLLESLSLHFRSGLLGYEKKLPDTFLRGPDLSDLNNLRGLRLIRVSLTSMSGFLLSATSLTDLTLQIDTAFNPSSETSLLACLKGMHSLCHLNLVISSKFPSQPSPPGDIVPLPKLIAFSYVGHGTCLDALVAELSAPSLRDVDIRFFNEIWPPIVYLPRFIDEMEEHYHSVHMYIHTRVFYLSFLIQLECISQSEPHFNLGPVLRRSAESIIRMSESLSMKFNTMEEICITFVSMDDDLSDDYIAWRMFLQKFLSVKAIWIQGADNYSIARILHQDHGNPGELLFLPSLEEVDLGTKPFDESECGSRLAAFEPFISARQKAGRPVNVFFRS